MSNRHTHRSRAPLLRAIAHRSLWGSLCLVHIAPVISATGALIHTDQLAPKALSGALVWLTLAFFTLKFADVPWLRWRAKRSSVLAFVAACGLAHNDVVPRHGAEAMLAQIPTAVASSLLCELARPSRRALAHFLFKLAGTLRSKTRAHATVCETQIIAIAGSLQRRVLATAAPPRAPPRR